MEFVWIGWCREGSSDKIWAVVQLEAMSDSWQTRKYATIWGRRGKALQSKIFEGDYWSMMHKVDGKGSKGYSEISLSRLDTVYPEFQQDLEKSAFWATLKG